MAQSQFNHFHYYVFSVLYEMLDCDFFRVRLLCDDHFMLVEQKNHVACKLFDIISISKGPFS